MVLELEELRLREGDSRELHVKEDAVDGLRWRLAEVARRAASNDVGAAA
jgi:hypothetical protein